MTLSFRCWASLSSCSATFTATRGKRTCSSTGAPRLRVGGKSTRNSMRTPLSSLNWKRSSVGWSLASTGNPAGTPSKSPGSPRPGSSCGEVRGSRLKIRLRTNRFVFCFGYGIPFPFIWTCFDFEGEIFPLKWELSACSHPPSITLIWPRFARVNLDWPIYVAGLSWHSADAVYFVCHGSGPI